MSFNKTPGNKRANSCLKKAVVHIPKSKGIRLKETLTQFVSNDAKSKSSNKSKLFKMMSPAKSKNGKKQFQIIQKSFRKSVIEMEQLASAAKEQQISRSTFTGSNEASQRTPKNLEFSPSPSNACDPVNEDLFLTPEVREDTNFLQKVRMENLN